MNIHGLSKHPLYGTWNQMVQRCTNEKHLHYKNYGGRGVKIHPDFLAVTGYVKYVEENLGPKPGPEFSMDRIDNSKGYEPGNLRWATRSEQNANQRQRVCDGRAIGASGHRGIRVLESGRYQARFHRGGEHTIGTFATLDEAIEARQAALA